MARTTKPKAEPTLGTYDNLSINELCYEIANTTEELQEVMRRLDDLNEDTEAWKNQVDSAYRDYLEEKAGLEEHLKMVEQMMSKRKHLSKLLAGYTDAFKNRMD